MNLAVTRQILEDREFEECLRGEALNETGLTDPADRADWLIAHRRGFEWEGHWFTWTQLRIAVKSEEYLASQPSDRDVEVIRLHSLGLTDRQLGERIGVGYRQATRIRVRLGLPSNSVGGDPSLFRTASAAVNAADKEQAA